MSEAKEIERFRFAESELGTLRRCEAAERDQPGLLRMQCQRKLRHPLAHHVEKASAVVLVIEDVVQVDVGQKRRDHRSLPRPHSLVVTTPSSKTPALSHLRIRRMMRGS